jgi:large subunit ribosomal protein L5
MKTRSEKWYEEVILPAWVDQGNVKNGLEVPKIKKVVCHIGVGRAALRRKALVEPVFWMTQVIGQQAITTKAKKSVAGFKVRKGIALGVKVTYRKEKVFNFLDNWVENVLPKNRDFRGLRTHYWDKKGNVTFSVGEGQIWPTWKPFWDNLGNHNLDLGFECTFVTTAKQKEESLWLFSAFQFPILSDEELMQNDIAKIRGQMVETV